MYVAYIVTITIYVHGGCPIRFKDYIGCGKAPKRYGTLARQQLMNKEDISIEVSFLCGENRRIIIPYHMVDYAIVNEEKVEIKEKNDE